MFKLSVAGAILVFAGVLGGQTSGKIDFGRDVQPIFQAYCVSCHGSSQQMAGFRIDQRRYALPNRVGANGARIVPGDSNRSRLYQKLIGNGSGLRMPPTGPLSQEQIGVIKAWIEQDAEWPDELSSETPRLPPDPQATRIMEALRNGDRQEFDKLLRENPKAAGGRGPGGSTPLMYAALYGDAGSVRRLLGNGANPNVQNDAGATALMWAMDDEERARLLLEGGADPNARSGEGRTALIIAAGRFGSSAVVKLLLDHGADPSAISSQGQSAASVAALAGDEEVLRILVARGADSKSRAGALPNAAQSKCAGCIGLLIDTADQQALNRGMVNSALQGDAPTLRIMLDRGAQANAPDPVGDGVSALMLAAGSESAAVETIQMLLERGADINDKSAKGETVLDMAKRHGATPISDFLKKAGATETNAPATPAAPPKPAKSIRAAAERSIPPLQRADIAFFKKSGCVSCHNNSLTMMTLAVARKNRLPLDEEAAQGQLRTTRAYIESWRERVLQGVPIPGGQDTISYILVGMAAANHPPDAGTDALARYLKNSQRSGGEWRTAATGGSRPPIESSDIEVTATSVRTLQVYAPKARRAEYQKAIQRAASWLGRTQPRTTEDRAFQLLGLSWVGEAQDILRKAGRALLAEQRKDGGWAQLPTLTSDSYATGEALVALKQAGSLAVTDAAYQRGVQFLISSQLEDGSWYVRSRAIPLQPYFDSDFPHGRDQFISAAATNWAVMALAPAAK
ncbi:MAG: ankyrin repeat domain-containing protein [Bryobacteraceae bacterium]|jgi:ankyrin repeat protein